ncbi:Adenylate cyclase 2 [Falsiruegeria mediterranea M17]|uniref:Adenylate cyclase 2 n=2 Tax=Falsiruegeria TaxID=2854184 RepID=A0A2R8C5L2_9RHOB|nr:Adenylate cyclase 2 [Falsiruegeria mediterranea M17]
MQNLENGPSMNQVLVSDAVKRRLVEREIRIQQSVEVQRFNPSIVLGNITLALIFFVIDPNLVISSGAVFVYALTAILVAQSIRSYLRLRHRERPTDVGSRRIQKINFYAGLIGLNWTIFSLLALRLADPVTSMVIVLGTSSFALASLVSMASSPIAGSLAAFPVIFANGFGMAFFGHLPVSTALLVSASLATITFFVVAANWQKTKMNVLTQVDSMLAKADRAETMERLSHRLAKYLSPQLYLSILTGEQTEEIVSKRKKLTVFFSDIVGFSEITDRLESEELSTLLNRYLTEMSLIAESHGGTIDKFIGDAIVVYFGDPESKGAKKDALACVRMAIEMQERVRKLKQEWLNLGLEETFDLRIGINTGYCTVGNFGSDQRVDYTIIGSEVNLAARLESAADIGCILLANETYALVKDWIAADEQEPMRVKGFERPIRTFQVRRTAELDTAEALTFHRREANLSLKMNHALMNDTERELSASILREALEKLDGRPAS